MIEININKIQFIMNLLIKKLITKKNTMRNYHKEIELLLSQLLQEGNDKIQKTLIMIKKKKSFQRKEWTQKQVR